MKENAIVRGTVYLHISDSGVNVSVIDEGNGPTLVIDSSSFGNMVSEMKIHTDRKSLEALRNMLTDSLDFKYSNPYCHAATTLYVDQDNDLHMVADEDDSFDSMMDKDDHKKSEFIKYGVPPKEAPGPGLLEYIKDVKESKIKTGFLTEENKIKLLELVLSRDDGWLQLAKTMKNSKDAESKCIEIFSKMADDTKVAIPFGNSEILVPLIDILVMELRKAVKEVG